MAPSTMFPWLSQQANWRRYGQVCDLWANSSLPWIVPMQAGKQDVSASRTIPGKGIAVNGGIMVRLATTMDAIDRWW